MSDPKRAHLLSPVGRTFLKGLTAVLPLTLTLYILWWLGTTAETVFGGLIQRLLPAESYVPGLGLVLGFGLVLAIGMTLSAWWVRSLWTAAERLLDRVPLVKTIYGSIKDLMSFFADGDRKSELNQVVMVRLGDPPVKLIGLITNDDAAEITGRASDSDLVAVYLPMSYQIGGFMVLVPRGAIEPLELGVEDAFRTVVTAGLSNMAPAAAKPGP